MDGMVRRSLGAKRSYGNDAGTLAAACGLVSRNQRRVNFPSKVPIANGLRQTVVPESVRRPASQEGSIPWASSS